MNFQMNIYMNIDMNVEMNFQMIIYMNIHMGHQDQDGGKVGQMSLFFLKVRGCSLQI